MGVQDYDITRYQPILFAAESIDQVIDEVGAFFDACTDESTAEMAASAAAAA